MATLTVGTLYRANYNGTAWSQPGGPGTTVYPQQNDGPFTNYPVPGQFIIEAGESLWRAACGHGFDYPVVFKDFDDATGLSAAVVACPLCSLITRLIEPYNQISDGTYITPVPPYPYIIP